MNNFKVGEIVLNIKTGNKYLITSIMTTIKGEINSSGLIRDDYVVEYVRGCSLDKIGSLDFENDISLSLLDEVYSQTLKDEDLIKPKSISFTKRGYE